MSNRDISSTRQNPTISYKIQPIVKFYCTKPLLEVTILCTARESGHNSSCKEENTMDNTKIQHFKEKLLKARAQIMNSGILNNLDDLKIKPDDLADEADLANNAISQSVSFSIREKEMVKLRRIDNALARIEEGTYGICIESGEEIEEKRLETQPWAEYCIEVAEEFEREQNKKFHRRA